jgi:hypothetical protein
MKIEQKLINLVVFVINLTIDYVNNKINFDIPLDVESDNIITLDDNTIGIEIYDGILKGSFDIFIY